MSRANPIALRIASKTQSSMFIGISQYYFDDQLKQNINIFKLTELLGKQLILPTNRLVKHNVVNSDAVTVLTPNILPINILCAAKQLFATKFTLNKRRFCSAILHYIGWLQDDFNTNYKRFQKQANKSSSHVQKSIQYKLPNQVINAINVKNTREKYAQKNHTQFCSITKANQINHIYKYFVFYQFKTKYNSNLFLTNIKFINSLMQLSSLAFNRGTQQKKNHLYMHTKRTKQIDGKVLTFAFAKAKDMENFKKTQNHVIGNRLSPFNTPFLKLSSAKKKTGVLSLQKVDPLCMSRPNYEHMTYSMYVLSFLSVLYLQHKQDHQVYPMTSISLSNLLQIGRQKSPLSTENVVKLKRYLADPASRSQYRLTKCRYVVSPYSGLKKSNNSTVSKNKKHINLFRNTIKPATSLELVIYRSFSEPAGLNYIGALENRLTKSHCDAKLHYTLFKRPLKSYCVPNHSNTQTGFIRLKAQMIFEFLYTVSYGGELEVGQKPWLRRESSIRL